jgi:hypothetical protein
MNLADNVSLRSDVLVCNRQYVWVDVLFIGESIDMTCIAIRSFETELRLF